MVPGERLITTTEVDNWSIDYERTTGPEPLYFKNKGGDAAGEENIIGHVFQPEHLYEDDTSDFRDKDVSIKTLLKELRRGGWPVEQAYRIGNQIR